MSEKIRVCSLFSGIGGFETGLFQSFGYENTEVVFASEIDKFAATSYETIYGHAPQGDITKIHEMEIPEHDLLVAGFPCQAFSVAGKRQGFEDTRGTLFFEVARILKWHQPKVALLENVKGLLNHDNGNTLKAIISVLNDIGYSVDFKVLNSKYFNVAQSRERIYIVAVRDQQVEPWDLSNVDNTLLKVKQAIIQDIEGLRSFNFPFPEENAVTLSLEDILEPDVESKYYLSDEICRSLQDVVSNINLDDYNHLDIKKIFDIPKELHNDQERQRRVYSIKGISPTVLARQDTTKIFVTEEIDGMVTNRIRKLTPYECLRLQGFPEEYYYLLVEKGLSVTQIYKQAGNAVTTTVIAAIANHFKQYLVQPQTVKNS